jgi:ParB/RepB/Spo0J family partition protein
MATATKSKIVGRPTSQLVPLADIDRDGRNHRLPSPDDKAKIAELAASLKRDGQLQAIRCYVTGEGQKLLLGYGHRRCAAAELAGMTTIRAEVRQAPRLADGEIDYGKIAAHRAIENLCRENLNPVEEAIGVSQILESVGGDVSRAAAMIGKSETWVRDRGYLSRLCKEVQERIIAGKLLLGYAREIAKLWTDKEQQITLAGWSEVRADGSCVWTLDTIRAEVKKRMRSLKVVAWDLSTPFAKAVACNACDLNTANDRNLFEHDAKRDDQAYCLDGICFARKSQAAQKAVEKAANSIVNQELPATAKAVADVTPEGVRPERVAREAKRLRGEEVQAEKGPEAEPKAGNITIIASAAGADSAISQLQGVIDSAGILAPSIEAFWNEHAEWSQATFGSDAERGPSGPLKHLALEAKEALENPTDIFEYADCLMLVLDATRRAGFSLRGLLGAAESKLNTNKTRQWPTTSVGEPVLHSKEESPDHPNAAALASRDKFREQHPGHVLLFRIGDWFRAFDGDAKILHKVCSAGLARKRTGKVTTLSASIPAQYAESKIKQLVAAGHKVALCERAAEVAMRDIAKATAELQK